MDNVKHMFCCLLALCMLLFSACGSEPAGSSASGSNPSGADSEPASVSTGAPESESLSDAVDDSVDEAVSAAWTSTPSIEETVLYEENGVRITATALNYSTSEAALDLTIQNETDTRLTFRSNTYSYAVNSVNGCMIAEGNLDCDVTPGNSARESVSFSRDGLMFCGITEIADIEVGIAISGDGMEDIYTGPLSVRTSLADTCAYSPDAFRDAITSPTVQGTLQFSLPFFSDEVICDQAGLVIESSALVTSGNGESMVLLETRNTTETALSVRLSDIAINGLLVSPGSWSTTLISPGKEAVLDVNLSRALDPSLWDTYGIRSVGSAGLTVQALDGNLDALTHPQPITITASSEEAVLDAAGTEVYSQNGIRLVSLGLRGPESPYSDDVRLLLMAENSSSQEVHIAGEYDSLSVNGYMTDFLQDSVTLAPGTSAALILTLQGYSLEDNGITDLSQIQTVGLNFRLNSDSQKVAIQTAG